MENLTADQRTRLDALMAALDRLPTSDAIEASGRLRCPLPLDHTGKNRMRLAIAGAIAAEKLLAYITALDDVDEHRDGIGREIVGLQRAGEFLHARRSLDAAMPLVQASHLAGRQEVDFHFFAVCVGRIERFLPIAAKAAGHKLPMADRELLATFRPLRDYFEHLEDRLPGRKNYDPVASEEEVDGNWRIRMSLTLDTQERIVMDGVAADVTTRGVATVRAVLGTHWEALKPSALALVRRHFEANPSYIPGLEAVDNDPLVSLGRKVGNDPT